MNTRKKALRLSIASVTAKITSLQAFWQKTAQKGSTENGHDDHIRLNSLISNFEYLLAKPEKWDCKDNLRGDLLSF